MSTNADQIAAWSGPAGEAWVAMQSRLDRQLEPLGQAALDALKLTPGERVADLGCGSGQTTRDIARRVGTTGSVQGFDISEPLLALARSLAPQLTFASADIQVADLGASIFDAAFSRFGVMFFSDPVAAFRNVFRALRPGGRLAFVCWRKMAENPVMTAPLEAGIAAGLPRPEAPSDPRAPGPFAFAERDYVISILEQAGFVDVALTPHDERVGGNDLDGTLELALQVGPLSRLLREHPQHRDAVLRSARDVLTQYLTNGVVLMPSATWIVTARRPT